MPISFCRFFKNAVEFLPRSQADYIPDNTRGIYALLTKGRQNIYDVAYIGCSAGTVAGIHARMQSHMKSKLHWTHFSVFEVHDNISREEIRELEGLFLHIYRRDRNANKLNRQRSHKNFSEITRSDFDGWK